MCPIPEEAGLEIDQIRELVSHAAGLLAARSRYHDNAAEAEELCYEALQRFEAFFEPDY